MNIHIKMYISMSSYRNFINKKNEKKKKYKKLTWLRNWYIWYFNQALTNTPYVLIQVRGFDIALSRRPTTVFYIFENTSCIIFLK